MTDISPWLKFLHFDRMDEHEGGNESSGDGQLTHQDAVHLQKHNNELGLPPQKVPVHTIGTGTVYTGR